MTAAETIEAYYDALRAGDPLAPFFADEALVKYGISEQLVGADEIRAGLREQTATTRDWTVESRALRVAERDCHAWFSDTVRLAWTDAESGAHHDFETRWSGTLERAGTVDTSPSADTPWRFVAMHVSTTADLTPQSNQSRT